MVKPRALIFGRNEGAPYHPLAPIEAEIVSLLEPAVDVAVADQPEKLTSLATSDYRLVVGLDDRWTEPLDPAVLSAVEAWVRLGGTLLLVHNGICWARDRRWRRLAGGRFVGHGPAKELTFRRRSDGETFALHEEPYRFDVPVLSGREVLVDYEDEGRRWPAFWFRKVGRGRVAYALPGHSVEAFRHPAYRSWLESWVPSMLTPGA